MKNTFLPEGYKQPDNSNYLKLRDGQNTFRVISSAIVGYEYWNNENKPIRSKTPFKGIPENIRIEKDGIPSKIKHFWAFLIWNYDSKKAQVLEITQTTIQSDIKALVDNKNWGDPKEYDITITRSGEGFETEYSVMPNPKTPLTPEIDEAIGNLNVNLEALYKGENPFEKV